MKNYVITGGAFTTAGNFTGYNALGERLHCHKRQMEQLGWKKDADVKFPFYAVGAVKEIGQLDPEDTTKPLLDANGMPVVVSRLTALSVFKTRKELVDAKVDEAMIDVELAQELKSQATSVGLNETAIEALVASIF